MSKFVSLSYFDLVELFRKSMFFFHRNKPMNLDTCLSLKAPINWSCCLSRGAAYCDL